jgi:hypothetical protein
VTRARFTGRITTFLLALAFEASYSSVCVPYLPAAASTT